MTAKKEEVNEFRYGTPCAGTGTEGEENEAEEEEEEEDGEENEAEECTSSGPLYTVTNGTSSSHNGEGL